MMSTRLHPKSLSAPHVKQLLCHTPPPLITTELEENRRRLDVVYEMRMMEIEMEEMKKTRKIIIGGAGSGGKKGREGRRERGGKKGEREGARKRGYEEGRD